MNADKVYVKDVINLLFRYKYRIAIITLLSIGFSVTLTSFIKKKYRTRFEINVYSKYFKNPLISDIVPGVYNIPEMRYTIDSMVKEAISDEYLDHLGETYKIYTDDTSEKGRARERQFLRDKFSYFSSGGQSYKIEFRYSDPFVTKKVAEETLEKVRNHFIDSRIHTIELVRGVMIRKLNSFSATQNIGRKGSEKILASKSPEVLKGELSKINSDMSALSKQYNDSHPKIRSLKVRKSIIKNWLKEFDRGEVKYDSIGSSFSQLSNKETTGKLSSDLYTKFHEFNVALEIERESLQSYIGVIVRPQLPTAPIWPKKRLFASVGFLLGLVISFLYVFMREILLPNREEELAIEAEKLGAFVIGVMPKLNHSKSSGNINSFEENEGVTKDH